jgi:hypothetical protein
MNKNKIRIGRKRLTSDSGVEAAVIARYTNPWAMLICQNFVEKLPTREEQRAFAKHFLGRFRALAGFVATAIDDYPASTHYREPFRRPAEFYGAHDVTDFAFPNLRDVPYREIYATLAAARGQFWIASKWPMTPDERTWLAERTRTATAAADFDGDAPQGIAPVYPTRPAPRTRLRGCNNDIRHLEDKCVRLKVSKFESSDLNACARPTIGC